MGTVTDTDVEARGADESVGTYAKRLRREARRRGLQLHRSRRRNPLARGYGTWHLTDSFSAATNAVVWPINFAGIGGTLDEVDAFLTSLR